MKKKNELHLFYSIYLIFYLIPKICFRQYGWGCVRGGYTDNFFFFFFFIMFIITIITIIIIIIIIIISIIQSNVVFNVILSLSLLFIIVMLFLCLHYF